MNNLLLNIMSKLECKKFLNNNSVNLRIIDMILYMLYNNCIIK